MSKVSPKGKESRRGKPQRVPLSESRRSRATITSSKDESHSISLRGIAYILIGLYLLTAFVLFTFNPLGGAKSFLGSFGFSLAEKARFFLGMSSYFLPLWALVSGIRRIKGIEKDKEFSLFSQTIGGLLSLVSLASVFGFFQLGGQVGDLFVQTLTSIVGSAGVFLTSAVIIGITFSMWSGASLRKVSSTTTSASFGAVKVVGQSSGNIISRFTDWFYTELRSAFTIIVSSLKTRKPVEQNWEKEIKDELPKPRRRKELKDEIVVDEEPIESFSVIETPPTHIVKRRNLEQPLTVSTTQSKDYIFPATTLLQKCDEPIHIENDEMLLETSRMIEAKLRDFSILGRVTEVHPGPVVTMYEFEPAPGVKVGKIAALQDDLSMSLKASSLRIVAPIPKKGTVGIEVPNRNRDIVRLRSVLESEAMSSSLSNLTIAIGKDTYGESMVADIAQMPHLLIAGATGTGKSVCINTVLVSLLYRSSPKDLGLILIDPKVLELSVYEGIPHLRVPVVTVPKQARAVLDWAVKEMDRRYRLMQKFGVRNIDGYNKVVTGEEIKIPPPVGAISLSDEEVVEEGTVVPESDKTTAQNSRDEFFTEKLQPLSKIVIVIDELADLMLTVGRDIEELITRLAQKARAAGIHLIVATQRPSVDVITGLIKANFPARLSFRVASRIDSRTILDAMGAEKLLGKGDMLFMLPGGGSPRRVHGAFVSDNEVKKVIDKVKENGPPTYDQRIMAICEKALEEEALGSSGGNSSGSDAEGNEYDTMYDKAVELVIQKGQASTSMIQRAFRIGYNRAARIIELMEKEGIVGPMDGVKPREVLQDAIADKIISNNTAPTVSEPVSKAPKGFDDPFF